MDTTMRADPGHAGAEPPTPFGGGRFEVLDGWRGVCAAMVVLFHIPALGGLPELPLIRGGYLFVDFFFVLSGFVITHAYYARLRGAADARRFVVSRLKRTYPLHLAMLLAFLAFELLVLKTKGSAEAFQGGNSVYALVMNLLQLHAFGTVDQLGWNYPSWSISAEFGAYVLFAAGMLLLGRRVPWLFAGVVLFATPFLLWRVGELDTTVDFGWLRCLLGFSCGALLRIFAWPPREASAPRCRVSWTAAEVAMLAAVGTFVVAAGHTPLSIAAPFVFTFAVYVFAHEAGSVSAILRWRLFAFLGLISYSIYLTHAFVISRVINVATVVEGRLGLALMMERADGSKAFGPSPLVENGAAVVILVATIIVSAVTWRLVERPFQKLSLSKLGRRNRPDASQPSATPSAA
ncbi:acyltransferase family protein [Mangrovicella endophytica]|uniref:acyltransferase family protein n=1 Tax=Mangrovicella endophytica TaxID=2066697 RepID=UPI0012FFEB9F|nr:acyltransferase [Mangrovicella endophytica]